MEIFPMVSVGRVVGWWLSGGVMVVFCGSVVVVFCGGIMLL